MAGTAEGCDILWLCLNETKFKTFSAYLRYAIARFSMYQREKAYRIYVCDTLQGIASGKGYIKQGYLDLIEPKPAESRTGEEIAEDVITRITKR